VSNSFPPKLFLSHQWLLFERSPYPRQGLPLSFSHTCSLNLLWIPRLSSELQSTALRFPRVRLQFLSALSFLFFPTTFGPFCFPASTASAEGRAAPPEFSRSPGFPPSPERSFGFSSKRSLGYHSFKVSGHISPFATLSAHSGLCNVLLLFLVCRSAPRRYVYVYSLCSVWKSAWTLCCRFFSLAICCGACVLFSPSLSSGAVFRNLLLNSDRIQMLSIPYSLTLWQYIFQEVSLFGLRIYFFPFPP